MADDIERNIFGSDSEDDEQPGALQPDHDRQQEEPSPANGADAYRDVVNQVFGSDDDDDLEPGRAPSGAEEDKAMQDEDFRQYERRTGPPMQLEVPLHNGLASEALRLVRLSNILGIEPRAFDATTFEAENTEYVDETGRKRIKLKDQNTIRWRWGVGPDGEPARQSNARFVRWSDGSLQLWLGDEVLDAKEIDIRGDQNFAFVRHQQLIQGQGQLLHKMVLQPASLASSFHKRLTAMVDKQHVRQSKVRATTTLHDPKKVKEEAARAEEARIRDREKLVERQQKQMRRYAAPRQPSRMTAAYLEEEEEEGYDEEGEGLEDTQRARSMLQQRRDYDEGAEAEAERRLTSAKAGPPSAPGGMKRGRTIEESDEEISGEEGGEEDDMKDFIVDDDEAAPGPPRRTGGEGKQKKQKRSAVVFSSDEEEEG